MEYKIFWCKVNKYYTDEWLNSTYLKNKDWIFIASCVVTDNAKKKWIKFIKNIASEISWNKKIFISGCWAFKWWEVQNDFFIIYPELNYLKWKIQILPEKPVNLKLEKDILKEKFKLIPQIYTKKFLLIQWWCDSFCSFCLTVKKRWKHYYRDKEDIVKEIINFEKKWGKEIVLTWVNLTAWWLNSTIPKKNLYNSRFAELLEYILKNTNIPRIRISSLWPEFVDYKCLELFKEKRIYPHFHYSVQSWSNSILKSMNRHYNWQYIKNLLEKTKKLKRKDNVEVSIWADLIVWFPWETENDFLDTYNLVKNWFITKVHIFPFSWHYTWETVPAWNFENQLSEKIKNDRLKKLEKIWLIIRKKFINNNIWKTFEVLIEKVIINNLWNISWKWWTENYIDVNENNFQILSWKIERNEIVKWIFKK